jgi:hypothetical protein
LTLSKQRITFRQFLEAIGPKDLPIENKTPAEDHNVIGCLPVTVGENLGGGRCYFALTVFSFCAELFMSPQKRIFGFLGAGGGPMEEEGSA